MKSGGAQKKFKGRGRDGSDIDTVLRFELTNKNTIFKKMVYASTLRNLT